MFYYCEGGKDWRGVVGFVRVGRCEDEVDVGDQGGDGGLHGVEDEWVGPAFLGGTVRCCCYTFLEDGPC